MSIVYYPSRTFSPDDPDRGKQRTWFVIRYLRGLYWQGETCIDRGFDENWKIDGEILAAITRSLVAAPSR